MFMSKCPDDLRRHAGKGAAAAGDHGTPAITEHLPRMPRLFTFHRALVCSRKTAKAYRNLDQQTASESKPFTLDSS